MFYSAIEGHEVPLLASTDLQGQVGENASWSRGGRWTTSDLLVGTLPIASRAATTTS